MTDLPSRDLAAIAERYWEVFLAFEPIYATYIGERRYDDRLDDHSDEAIAAQLTAIAELAREAEAIPIDDLDMEDRITRSALVALVRADTAQLDANLEAWTVDPLDGPQVIAFNLSALQPADTPEQARAMVTRWNAMGEWLERRAERLRRSAARGKVGVRSTIEKVVDQMTSSLAQADDDTPLLAALSIDHDDWDPIDVNAFEADLRAAVRDVVRPALERYLAVVRDEILPIARPDTRPGLMHLPDGLETYERLIERHTSLPLTADEIHAIGLEEVARIDAETAALGERVLGTSDLVEIRRRLRSDPAMHFESRDEVRAMADESLARADKAVLGWFGILPKTPCVVITMPEHEERHSTIAYYRQPAMDGSRPGQYAINTSEPTTRPRYEAQALAYHEAVPGHHLQLAIGQELTDLPEFRRNLGPTAFVEGWGLYIERLAEEMGLYSSDLDRIGVLSFDAWRACRLVVDTGMHALGWTRQEAIDYMLEHSVLAENNVVNEVDRYIAIPGQALAYKIGQREILRLRAEAMAAQGAAFDIRGFHDAVLGHGAVGLETLGEIVRDWSHRVAGER